MSERERYEMYVFIVTMVGLGLMIGCGLWTISLLIYHYDQTTLWVMYNYPVPSIGCFIGLVTIVVTFEVDTRYHRMERRGGRMKWCPDHQRFETDKEAKHVRKKDVCGHPYGYQGCSARVSCPHCRDWDTPQRCPLVHKAVKL